jgi:hypothetical protein
MLLEVSIVRCRLRHPIASPPSRRDELEFFYPIYVNQDFRVRESEVQHGSQALSSG